MNVVCSTETLEQTCIKLIIYGKINKFTFDSGCRLSTEAVTRCPYRCRLTLRWSCNVQGQHKWDIIYILPYLKRRLKLTDSAISMKEEWIYTKLCTILNLQEYMTIRKTNHEGKIMKYHESNIGQISTSWWQKLWSRSMVPQVCCADSKGSATSCQGIRGYIFLMATLKFTYF
jgi:hypothetical protein